MLLGCGFVTTRAARRFSLSRQPRRTSQSVRLAPSHVLSPAAARLFDDWTSTLTTRSLLSRTPLESELRGRRSSHASLPLRRQ